MTSVLLCRYLTSAVGLLDSGTYKGYVYSESWPDPVVGSLDGREDEAWAFVHLADNWYIGQGERPGTSLTD